MLEDWFRKKWKAQVGTICKGQEDERNKTVQDNCACKGEEAGLIRQFLHLF